jgi:hypothetical protein
MPREGHVADADVESTQAWPPAEVGVRLRHGPLSAAVRAARGAEAGEEVAADRLLDRHHRERRAVAGRKGNGARLEPLAVPGRGGERLAEFDREVERRGRGGGGKRRCEQSANGREQHSRDPGDQSIGNAVFPGVDDPGYIDLRLPSVAAGLAEAGRAREIDPAPGVDDPGYIDLRLPSVAAGLAEAGRAREIDPAPGVDDPGYIDLCLPSVAAGLAEAGRAREIDPAPGVSDPGYIDLRLPSVVAGLAEAGRAREIDPAPGVDDPGYIDLRLPSVVAGLAEAGRAREIDPAPGVDDPGYIDLRLPSVAAGLAEAGRAREIDPAPGVSDPGYSLNVTRHRPSSTSGCGAFVKTPLSRRGRRRCRCRGTGSGGCTRGRRAKTSCCGRARW